MSRAQLSLQYLANAVVGGTGVVYFVMKHLMTSDDPFSVVNHPAQPLVQHLHVLSAPGLVFMLGLLWALHASPNARRAKVPGWRSGMVLLIGAGPMVASGYLLQISVEPTWRTVWLWTHLASSGLWLLGTVLHLVWPRLAALGTRRMAQPVGDGGARR